ncbi:MAG TPA: elongation factor G [Bacteroidales bacterium]|nr:elongation factor G [Bacteroidales bacterium]HRZ49303.1 elongation factor G [Bacteroidales bacterium]
MKVYQTNEVRNIALIGGAKSGKTTIAESMLFESGQINRRGTVDDKNTVSDYKQVELERGNSVYASILHAEYAGKKINIIDTPGFHDFIGETVEGLSAADAAMMMVNAQEGIQVGTEITWRLCNQMHKPVFLVLNQLDHEKVNVTETMSQLKSQFGDKVVPMAIPLHPGLEFNSIIDLVELKLLKYPKDGGKPEVTEIPAAEKGQAEDLHLALVEAAAEGSEELMEKYFEEGSLTPDEIRKGIRMGMITRGIFPVFATSAKRNIGVGHVLSFIANTLASPADLPGRKDEEGNEVKYNPNGPALALVFKTSVEPHLGEVSYFKVFSGEIKEGSDYVNINTGSKERITQIFVMSGKNREKIEKIVAGDIGATIKLKDTKTNQTIGDAKAKNPLEKMAFPDPIYTTAVKAVASTDDEKMNSILYEMHHSDPTLLVNYSREQKQLILQGQGDMHINKVKWYFDNIHKIEIEFIAPKIPYRETITRSAKAMYRHKKQSGGSGQFGEVHMMIEPWFEGMEYTKEFPVRGTDEVNLTWGGKLIMNNCIVGGAIDARFLPAIMKGLMERMEVGPLTGSYARDIVVSIYDGKMHPVDSNEISFRLAGRHAFSDAFKNAGPKILEPIYEIEVMVPEEKMGDVMTDLQGRRAIILGMGSDGSFQVIKAKVPLAEMHKYSTSLSSITSGRATFSMAFLEYAQVPGDIQTKLLKEYEEASKDEE